METMPLILALSFSAGLGLFVLYQVVKNWKFVLSYLLMPLAGLLVVGCVVVNSQFSDAVYPLILGMAGIAGGALLGHLTALKLK